MISLCNGWEFCWQWSEAFARGEGEATAVRLPHTVKEMPVAYADHTAYQTVCGYRRILDIGPELLGKRLYLQFDGAAHIAEVYLNGKFVGGHRCGYTAFRCDITDAAVAGENRIAVRLDTTENPQVPPFGFVIDYLTYGGLYREVWLDIRQESQLEDVFVSSPTLDSLRIETRIRCPQGCTLEAALKKGSRILVRNLLSTEGPGILECPGLKPWEPERPVLYRLELTLRKDGQIMDQWSGSIGLRTVEFRADGFYLNGKKTFLRGLNRHQAFAYMGDAAPESLQREDARILKQELGCNAVRTSHYPQSHHFLEECDRLGLLVFTEIPGWQHISDDPGWRQQAVENVKDMVIQYRNHPSIVLWGVRINESQDDDELYALTNAAARELDPTRPTSGVRYTQKSSLLEDVYAFNDFSHTGDNAGVRPKKTVTPDEKKGLVITEHNGHMFPTKASDPWEKRQSHALRHARVLSDAVSGGEHGGCFGWCMFDYPTHKDFGSGDRICHHGVMDLFRNPKCAAGVYASQQEEVPVLTVCSSMDIGDYPAGMISDVAVFSNADSICLYKNDEFVTELKRGDYPGLAHPPFILDDTIGCLLEKKEGFDKKKADLLRHALLTIRSKGLAGLNPADMARMGYAMVRYGLKYSDAVALYGKYVGNWGGEATRWRLDAKKDGRDWASVTLCPSARLQLEVIPSHTALKEGATYDMAAVRIRIRDDLGNPAPYAQLPVRLRLEGPACLVGPDVVAAPGGMCAAYIKTLGQAGTVRLTVSTAQTEDVTVEFTVEV